MLDVGKVCFATVVSATVDGCVAVDVAVFVAVCVVLTG